MNRSPTTALRSPSLFVSALGLVPLLVLAGCIKMAPTNESGQSVAAGGETLREAAARAHKHIGTALATYHFDEPEYQPTAARHFDSMTPENEMKWEVIEPQQGSFQFTGGDRLVAFAAAHGMRVRGHTLVWHNQLAPWVKNLSGTALHDAMIHHVQGVVGHYKGHIAQWDVVNEVMADGDSGTLRPDSPFASIAPGFIEDAFRAAHETDPDAVLFYNDYDIEGMGTPKSEAAYGLVKHLKETGVPIGGVGFQMHVDPRKWPAAADIRKNIERYAALGVVVEFTEMDVPVGAVPGTVAQKLEAQRVLTHDIVAACVAVPQCTGVTFWGFNDKHSWLNDPHWASLRGPRPHYPLPFDDEYEPKPMYAGILAALEGR